MHEPRIDMTPEEQYLQFLLEGQKKANAYWNECQNEGRQEEYVYGRNNVLLNLYYAETGNRWQVYQQTIIPAEVWADANQIFGKLMSLL
jgi:hypothetical protein